MVGPVVDHEDAVHIEPDAVVAARDEIIGAADWGDDEAGPADAEIVSGQAGIRSAFRPVEFQHRIGAGEDKGFEILAQVVVPLDSTGPGDRGMGEAEDVRCQIRHERAIGGDGGRDADGDTTGGTRRDGPRVGSAASGEIGEGAICHDDIGRGEITGRVAQVSVHDKGAADAVGVRSEHELKRLGRCCGQRINALHVAGECRQVRVIQHNAGMRENGVGQGGRASVMQVGGGGVDAAQRRHVKAGQRPSESEAAGGQEGADVGEDARGAVGEAAPAMAARTLQRAEDLPSGGGIRTEAALRGADGAVGLGGEGVHIRGEGVEIGAAAGIGGPQRRMRRTTGDETCAAG